MHPLRHPRNAIFVGLAFSTLGVIYLGIQLIAGWAHVDYAGTTMLILLGVAMSILFYVLIAGSPND
jgi:hypothetical protein